MVQRPTNPTRGCTASARLLPASRAGARNHDGAFANFVRTSDAAAMFRGMVEILSSRRGVLTTSDEFGKQTRFLTAQNGLVDLQTGVHALEWLFARPIFSASDFVQMAGIPAPTARRFLGVLKKHKIINELMESSGRRSAVLVFPALLNIAEGREVF